MSANRKNKEQALKVIVPFFKFYFQNDLFFINPLAIN
jgi:hypothetical protein